MKGILLFAFVFVIGLTAGLLYLAPSPAPVDKYCSVCDIDMGSWTGSGTLVGLNSNGDALILTCRHVAVNEGATADIMFPSTGFFAKGRVTTVVPGEDFRGDLAMIVCKAPPGLKPLPISKFDPQYAPFHAVGFRDHKMYESVSATGKELGNGLIQFPKPLIGGMSGGPVIDSRGCVVGVGVGSTKVYSVASDGEALVELVDSYKE